MPMRKGRSRKVVSQNIREFHTGPTYARTKAKFGKDTADRQAIAAALDTRRRSMKEKRGKDREARTRKRKG